MIPRTMSKEEILHKHLRISYMAHGEKIYQEYKTAIIRAMEEYAQLQVGQILDRIENELDNPKRPTTGKTDEWSPLS